MSALKNARHERFSQELAKGKAAEEAYAEAGYRSHRQNASRLMTNDDVRARLAELKERAAIRTEITVAALTDRLLAIAAKCEATDDAAMLAVARASLMDAAKLNGLIVDRMQNDTRIQSVISDRPMDENEWVKRYGPGAVH